MTTISNLADTIAGVIERVTGVPKINLAPDTRLSDVTEDSLEYIEILCEVEFEFDIDLHVDTHEQIETVSQLVDAAKRAIILKWARAA